MSESPDRQDEAGFARTATSAPASTDLATDPTVGHERPLPERPLDRARLPQRPFGAADDQSFIDLHSTFSGKYDAARDLLVQGTAEGEIACEGRLTVAEAATVKARVTAADITVAGMLDGEITCEGLLEVLPTGRVQGTVSTARLVVQEGAFCDGTIHMQQREPDTTPESDDESGSPTSIFKSPVRKVD